MPDAFVVAPRPAASSPARHAASPFPPPAASPFPPPRAARQTWEPALAAFAPWLDDEVTDLFVNGASGLFIDRGRGAEPVAQWCASEADVRALAVALIGAGGRHLDDAAPCVDVRLTGGVRVHAVLPPVAPAGTTLSIRLPRTGVPDLDDLVARGLTDADGAARLRALVTARTNLLLTGAAGSGKTTLLSALLSEAAPHERIVTVEDVAEVRLRHPHHVALEARQPNLEGAGGVDLPRLVREALRMRPDRLVVGECRGAEIRDLLAALNTGHAGGGGTLHAGGIDEVPARLEALGALAGLDGPALARQTVSAIGTVLHLERGEDGVRRIVAAGTPVLDGDRLGMRSGPWG